jgi:two-component system cell cycle response regulator
MPDRILIVDEVATNRIVLKVKLTTASYDVDQASTLAAALQSVAARAPGLVLLSDRIGGADGAEEFCRRLAADAATADVPVIVIGPDRGQEHRLSLLSAGAADHLVRPLDDATLLARVRSLLRQRPHDLTPSLGGLHFAEAAAPRPERPGVIAVVTPHRETGLRWKAALSGRMRERILCLSPDGLLDALRTDSLPDAFVISGVGGRLADLRLIADLKARPETEDAPILMIGAGVEPEFGIMALDLGAGDVLQGGFDADELMLRLRTRLRQKREGERRRRHVEEGLRLAVTDPLTGLMNRRAVFSRLADIARGSAAEDQPYALMLLDIDRFKSINDTHGHAAGDAVLRELASRLSANMREGDLLGRIGGEEFLVALPATPMDRAQMAAERLRRVTEAEPVIVPSGLEVYVTLSIGLCLGNGGTETAEAICNRADRALYAAKARGRNTVTIGRPAA